MKFRSTNQKAPLATAAEALFQGLAADGGLFMPTDIPQLPRSFIEALSTLGLPEIAARILQPYFEADIPFAELEKICLDCFSFPAPLAVIDTQTSALELFHGPTLAFKDFGARFLARSIAYLRRNASKPLTVLVATSGDTGGAVASGFFKIPGVNVIILYPSGQVTPLQEKQLTTLGENIRALEIRGTFDDCQALVKQAFVDATVVSKLELTSANSINIGRLLPQMTYYFSSFGPAEKKSQNIVYSVPSGNLGNLTAGVIATFMGLPVKKFILAANANRSAVNYLNTGEFLPSASIRTCSNAMDVGNPSNQIRLKDIFKSQHQQLQKLVCAASFSDDATKAAIKRVYQTTNYLLDPHGAVAYLGWEHFQKSLEAEFDSKAHGVLLETAHPAKFLETVEPVLGSKLTLPIELQKLQTRQKNSIVLGREYSELKDFLLSVPT